MSVRLLTAAERTAIGMPHGVYLSVENGKTTLMIGQNRGGRVDGTDIGLSIGQREALERVRDETIRSGGKANPEREQKTDTEKKREAGG